MAMQRGIRPQMPIGKLKSPGVFGQQEKTAEPAWRAAAPVANKFNVNKTATPSTVTPTTSADVSTVSSVPPPTTPAPPAEAAAPPPSATSPAPSAANKLNLSKFQQAPKVSSVPPPTTPAPPAEAAASPPSATSPAPSAANKLNLSKFQQAPKVLPSATPTTTVATAVTSSASLPGSIKSSATSAGLTAQATSSVSSVPPPTSQAPPAEAAATPPSATSPAPSAANKLNLSKFQQAPNVAPKPSVPSPSPLATTGTAASSSGTPAAVTTTTASAAVPAPKKEVSSNLASPVTVPNKVISNRSPATTNVGQSSETTPPGQRPKVVPSVPVPAVPDTIVRASVQTAQSAPVLATSSSASATTQPAPPAAQPVTSPTVDGNKPKTPPVVVLDPPTELMFRGSFSNGITSRIRLTNSSAESRVCFKVKTNVPPYYTVQPSIDLIEPLQHVDVAVYLQATSDGRPDADGQHKFMVQSIFAPDGDITSLDRLWQQARPNEIASSKLVCVFEQVVENRPTKCSSSVFNGIETSQVTQVKTRDLKAVQQTTKNKSSSSVLWVLMLAVVVAVIAVAVYQSSLK